LLPLLKYLTLPSYILITQIMKEGIVKFFNEVKKFGFIKDKDSDNEYFVHVSDLIDDIQENDEVTFEAKEGEKGLYAVNVKRI
jgi:cold shock protein